jgi:hypothetical protein
MVSKKLVGMAGNAITRRRLLGAVGAAGVVVLIGVRLTLAAAMHRPSDSAATRTRRGACSA